MSQVPAFRGADTPPILKFVAFLASLPQTTVLGADGTWSLIRYDGIDLPRPVTLNTTLTTADWPEFVRQNAAVLDDKVDDDSAFKLIMVHMWETISSALDQGRDLNGITLGVDGAHAALTA